MESTLDGGCRRLDESPHSSRHSSGGTPLFAIAVIFVGAVSVYDGYLVVRTGDMILDFEKNPIGVYLIKCNHGDPAAFLQFKAAGTVLALSALSFLHHYARRLAAPVVWALFVFQSGLLIFLEGPFS